MGARPTSDPLSDSIGDSIGDPISDDELALEALAAGDPDQAIPADAVPFSATAGGDAGADGVLLPAWYMPAPGATSRRRSHRVMAWAFIGSLVAINVSGLCITYGHLVVA